MIRTFHRRDDNGAALILALILITVVAVVVSVVLSFADTNLRVTVAAARPQAASAANADGATQVAINTLRNSTYNSAPGQRCFADSSGNLTLDQLSLSNFPSAGSSAFVSCSPDPGSGTVVQINSHNKPGSAILTLATAALNPGEEGLKVSISGGNTLRVHGGIFSNSTINATAGSVTTDTWVRARGTCSGPISSPDKICAYAAADVRDADPNYPAPTAAATPQALPACNGHNKLVQFLPGLYTDAVALSAMMRSSGCKDSIWHFNPGTYYFDFAGGTSAADTWTIDTGSLVGGTPKTPLVAGTAPTIPGSCVSPIDSPIPNQGVQFVFGGDSHLAISHGQVELCGNYSATSPPIAIYGLKTAVGPVHAQSGCILGTPYPSTGCALIFSDNSPNSAFYVQGTAYAPKAAFDISLNNATGQVFKFGVISRSLMLNMTGSFSLTSPVIELPDDSPGYTNGDTVVYLTTYVCPGVANASSCISAAPPARLRAAADIIDPTPGTVHTGNRQMTITNWNALR
jgi:Tfp pilus assembly protein PilX